MFCAFATAVTNVIHVVGTDKMTATKVKPRHRLT